MLLDAAPAAAWSVPGLATTQCEGVILEATTVPLVAPEPGDAVVIHGGGGECALTPVARHSRELGVVLWVTPVPTATNLRIDGQGNAFVRSRSFGEWTYKLDGFDGHVAWKVPYSFFALTPDGDAIAWFRDRDRGIVPPRYLRLDGTTGGVVWASPHSDLDFFLTPTVAVDATGDAYFAGATSITSNDTALRRALVVKVDGANGQALWRYELGEGSAQDVVSVVHPTADGDVLVIGTFTTAGVAREFSARLAGATGTETWRRTPTDWSLPQRADPAGSVFGAVEPVGVGTVRRIDPLDGTASWATAGTVTSPFLSHPYIDVDGDFLLVSRPVDAQVTKLDGATGAMLWTTTSPGWSSIEAIDDAGDFLLRAGTLGTLLAKRRGDDGSDYVGSALCPNSVVEPGETCDDGNATPGDGCDAGCALEPGWTCPARGRPCFPLCGDGLEVGAEQLPGHCDDGNLDSADGCDFRCLDEQSAAASLPPGGGSIATGVATSDVAPLHAALFSPNEGATSLLVTSATTPQPTGFELLGKQVRITAPPASAQVPLRFTFVIDASLAPGGDPNAVEIFRNGAFVAECPGAVMALSDTTPCVTSRTLVGDDVHVVVLSAAASVWDFGSGTVLPSAAVATCRKQLRRDIVGYAKARLLALQKCSDAVNAGATGPCPDAKAAVKLAKAVAKIKPVTIDKACPAAALQELVLGGACAAAMGGQLLRDCIAGAVDQAVATMIDAEYADPNGQVGDDGVSRCQASIARESGQKYAVARLAATFKCHDALEAGRVPGCLTAKDGADLAKIAAQLDDRLSRRCTDAQIITLGGLGGGFGGACAAGPASVAALASCELQQHDVAVEGLIDLVR